MKSCKLEIIEQKMRSLRIKKYMTRDLKMASNFQREINKLLLEKLEYLEECDAK